MEINLKEKVIMKKRSNGEDLYNKETFYEYGFFKNVKYLKTTTEPVGSFVTFKFESGKTKRVYKELWDHHALLMS